MDSEKDILMFYHSSLRNVALFASVGLGLQAYSVRIKDKLQSNLIYVGFLLFTALAIYLNYLLIIELNSFDDSKHHVENTWIYVPYISIVFLSCVLFIKVPELYKKLLGK